MNTYNYSTRSATANDAMQIAEIYNQGIADRIATFETGLRSVEDIIAWFDDHLHPTVVVLHENELVAFATSSFYRLRACYAQNAEFSVYVRRDYRGCGAGRVAMLALIQAASDADLHKLVSRVFVENTASRHLLHGLGFREVGVYEQHGQLDGLWRDVVIVERLL